VAAGISLAWLEKRLVPGIPLVGTMPNLPCQVKEGATAACMGTWTQPRHKRLVDKVIQPHRPGGACQGRADRYHHRFKRQRPGLCIYDDFCVGGSRRVQSGLTGEVAFPLAVQTVLGAAKLVKESGLDSLQLVQLTSSKGGTTLAGLQELENGGFAAMWAPP
jgi:pyrroline-5-carboxylate reductase